MPALWQWKVLVLDEHANRIIDNVASEDDILNQNVASMPSPDRPDLRALS